MHNSGQNLINSVVDGVLLFSGKWGAYSGVVVMRKVFVCFET